MINLSRLIIAIEKFAKLTDEMCNDILRDPKLKVIIEEKGLLDEFSKALPQLSEEDIKQEHKHLLDELLTKSMKIDDPELESLVNEFGSFMLSEQLIEYLSQRYMSAASDLKSDYDIDEIEFMLAEFTLKSLVDIALIEKAFNRNIANRLKSALKYYKEVQENKEDKNYSLYMMKAIQMVAAEMGSLVVFIATIPHTTNESKYREALAIRDSEKFDFIDDENFDIDKAYAELVPEYGKEVKTYEETYDPDSGYEQDDLGDRYYSALHNQLRNQQRADAAKAANNNKVDEEPTKVEGLKPAKVINQ